MATHLGHSMSTAIPDSAGIRIGIAVSEWNADITNALLDGAIQGLLQYGISKQDILIRHIPGSFELPLAAKFFAEYTDVDAVICLGCIIQGETRHFDFVAKGVTEGVLRISLEYNLPVIFGVLTTESMEQALDRAGGKYGNKGTEAAWAALRMVHLQFEMEQDADDLGMTKD